MNEFSVNHMPGIICCITKLHVQSFPLLMVCIVMMSSPSFLRLSSWAPNQFSVHSQVLHQIIQTLDFAFHFIFISSEKTSKKIILLWFYRHFHSQKRRNKDSNFSGFANIFLSPQIIMTLASIINIVDICMQF